MSRPLFSLGERLFAVAEFAKGSHCIIDVGSDHARLPVWMLKNNYVQKAFASDISPFCTEKCAAFINRYGLSENIEVRCCDGLSAFSPDDADTVVIAGMGGDTISNILASAPWCADGKHTVILQCMSSFDELNSFLHGRYIILDEVPVKDSGRLYSVMKLTGGRSTSFPLTPSQNILKSHYAKDYLERLIYIEKKRLRELQNASNAHRDLEEKINNNISYYKQLLEEIV